MTILYVKPEEKPIEMEIDNTLKTMQELVGGTIQVIYPFEDHIALVCNDEGKMMQLPMNRGLCMEDGSVYDVISGNFFLCNAPPDHEDFASLTDTQLESMMSRFAAPEVFLWDGAEMLIVKGDA